MNPVRGPMFGYDDWIRVYVHEGIVSQGVGHLRGVPKNWIGFLSPRKSLSPLVKLAGIGFLDPHDGPVMRP